MLETNSITRRDPQVRRAPAAAGLYDVLDLILDKGIVIDAFVRVSLVGIELLTVDARVVIASVDTYLRYAEGAERLQLYARSEAKRLPDMVEGEEDGSGGKKMLKKGAKAAGRLFNQGDEDEHGQSQDEGEEGQEQEQGIGETIAKGMRKAVGKVFHSVTGSEESEEEGQRKKGAPEERPRQANGSGGHKLAKAGARR